VANPSKLTYQLAASVSNGVSLAQRPLVAGRLILNGSLSSGNPAFATFDTARRVLVSSTSAGDGAVVFTIVGTDRNGNAQTSLVTGVAAGAPVGTALDFYSVKAVSSSSGTAGNITVGTSGVGSSAWQQDNFLAPAWAMAIATSGPAGTNYTVEHTYDDFNLVVPTNTDNFSLEASSTSPPVAWANPVINNVSGSNEVRYVDWPIFGHRLTVVSGTGLVTMWQMQQGIGST
jgi:hypothetical protein